MDDIILELSNNIEFVYLLRLIIAAILGAIIGLDRTRKGRAAGIKTHALVCLGACLVMVTSLYIAGGDATLDVTRMPAQVISGIGFLGAGTIIVTRNTEIRGLTTAAGLWFASTLGLAVGIGFYSGAITSLIMVIVIVKIFGRLDTLVSSQREVIQYQIYYDTPLGANNLIYHLTKLNCEIISFEINDEEASTGRYSIHILIALPRNWDEEYLKKQILAIESVIKVKRL